MSWKLWAWQRFQQAVGALAILLPTGCFIAFLVLDVRPEALIPHFLTGGTSDSSKQSSGQQNQDLKNLDNPLKQEVLLKNLDNPRLDHVHIATTIGSCRLQHISPVAWPEQWLHVLKVSRDELRATGTGNRSAAVKIGATGSDTVQDTQQPPADEYILTPFERAAIYQSDRIAHERGAFASDADTRQSRLRSNQTRILLVSAAAAFLVGLRALVASKDSDLPFRSLMQGALLPISALVLLMPVIGTALSGLVAFDDDATAAIRDARAVSQLEQLHGRIAEDVISDPYLCPLAKANLRLAAPGAAESSVQACVSDRFQRTTAWEQRHEQILNDANQTLAHAGDLPKPGESKPVSEPSSGDKCQQAFPALASLASAELTRSPAQASIATSRAEQQEPRLVPKDTSQVSVQTSKR